MTAESYSSTATKMSQSVVNIKLLQ